MPAYSMAGLLCAALTALIPCGALCYHVRVTSRFISSIRQDHCCLRTLPPALPASRAALYRPMLLCPTASRCVCGRWLAHGNLSARRCVASQPRLPRIGNPTGPLPLQACSTQHWVTAPRHTKASSFGGGCASAAPRSHTPPGGTHVHWLRPRLGVTVRQRSPARTAGSAL
jgi:hypothetical protein